MEEQDYWKPFAEVDFSDEKILQYHIDTRDFHCNCFEEKADKAPCLSTLKKYGDRFFFTAEEVKGMVSRYYEESGGEKDWRLLALEGDSSDDYWRMKYIRIFRTEFGLVVCDIRFIAIRREVLNSKAKDDTWGGEK